MHVQSQSWPIVRLSASLPSVTEQSTGQNNYETKFERQRDWVAYLWSSSSDLFLLFWPKARDQQQSRKLAQTLQPMIKFEIEIYLFAKKASLF